MQSRFKRVRVSPSAHGDRDRFFRSLSFFLRDRIFSFFVFYVAEKVVCTDFLRIFEVWLVVCPYRALKGLYMKKEEIVGRMSETARKVKDTGLKTGDALKTLKWWHWLIVAVVLAACAVTVVLLTRERDV